MDLDSYLILLQRYLQSSSGLNDWIDDTRQRLDTMRATKTDDIAVLTQHHSKQKVEQPPVCLRSSLLV